MKLTNADDPVHFMMDIETLDTIPSAVILSIGACVIETSVPKQYAVFYTEPSVASQGNRTQSLDAIAWWNTQGNAPVNGTLSLLHALMDLRTYFEQLTTRPIIWCKGTDFDVAILDHAYKQVGLQVPWKYNDVRDFRTIKKVFPDRVDPNLTNEYPHNALEDAIFQARQLTSIGLKLQ